MWSGFAAVVAVNLVIFSYVRMAWNEEDINVEKKTLKSDISNVNEAKKAN